MKRILLLRCMAIYVLCFFPLLSRASGFDPFSVQDRVAKFASKEMIPTNTAQDPCGFAQPDTPLDLVNVVERALCHNPQTRQVWANVKAQAAQVGVSQSAYLPSVTAGYSEARGSANTSIKGAPQLSYGVHTRTRESRVDLTWTLFDFGLRRSNLENARQLLIAANATQDAALQKVFMDAAQAYYELRMAKAALDASKEAETLAEESYKAVDAKYSAGVGSLADKLQAQTSFAQAKSNRVKANGELNSAQGALAIVMGLNANAAFALTDDRPILPDEQFQQDVDALIEDAVRTHPSLIAAQAQLKAAQANVEVAKAEGMPSVAITGSVSKSDQLGQYPEDTFVKNGSIGLQVKIPLFEGFGRSYRVQSAEAQVESKMADLANTEQQVSLEVWKSYQALLTESENLNSTSDLLQSADQSFKVALGRYKAGVGNMLELLSAQSARASAQQQRIQALSNWQFTRLKLAGSLGRLGLR